MYRLFGGMGVFAALVALAGCAEADSLESPSGQTTVVNTPVVSDEGAAQRTAGAAKRPVEVGDAAPAWAGTEKALSASGMMAVMAGVFFAGAGVFSPSYGAVALSGFAARPTPSSHVHSTTKSLADPPSTPTVVA